MTTSIVQVLGLCGSLRRGSFNLGLLHAAQELAPRNMQISLHDIKALPFFCPDDGAGGDPEPVRKLRRELGVPQIALIAHSFGGILALEYAATYPTRVSRLVIVSGIWSVPVQGRYQCERIRTVSPALAHAAASVATGPDDNCAWFWTLPAPQRDPLYRALMFPDSTVRERLDSTVAASGLRNTGELSGRCLAQDTRSLLPSPRSRCRPW